MPSPIGHAIGGVAAGWAVLRSAPDRAGLRRDLLLFGTLGALADADLLLGAHSGPTHGVGAAVLAGAVAWGIAGARRVPGAAALALACSCAYASHTLLDWLGTDTAPPIGIMALWPLRRDYYQSGLHVFRGVSRQIFQPELFWMPNLRTLIRELLVLLPVLGSIAFLRRRR